MRIPLACLAVALFVVGPLQGFGSARLGHAFAQNDFRWLPLADGTLDSAAAAAVSLSADPTAAPAGGMAGLSMTSPADVAALNEMLRGPKGRQQWVRAPELVILVPVMEYHVGEATEYVATAEEMTDPEMDELVSDLTLALRLLSGDTFEQFAAIRRESAPEGANVRVVRPGQIVVGRYRGLRTLQHVIGLGGRSAQPDGTISSGAIVLDSEYDHTNALRRLLRTHELGHALGYNHVRSRPSIMNDHIGAEPTEFDRVAVMTAFKSFPQHPSEQ